MAEEERPRRGEEEEQVLEERDTGERTREGESDEERERDSETDGLPQTLHDEAGNTWGLRDPNPEPEPDPEPEPEPPTPPTPPKGPVGSTVYINESLATGPGVFKKVTNVSFPGGYARCLVRGTQGAAALRYN